jgi:spore photoproduct lyase
METRAITLRQKKERMALVPRRIYYEPPVLDYKLGKILRQKFSDVPWIPIKNHNNIEELCQSPNSDFIRMKQYLIVGVRKTHKYVPNHKSSDFLVPYTSSGCSAACLYCYLVCNYNKCSYLRLFVNREQMLGKLIRTAQQSPKELTFEIGSNSDLVLENTITGNLLWTIETFAKEEKGFLTFPTKFNMVEPLLGLEHRGRVVFRMNVNPEEIIRRIELGTSPLGQRIDAVNKMAEAGYRIGLLVAPVVMVGNWKQLYSGLFDILAEKLSPRVKREMFFEVIFMTYSYVHRAINKEAFPNAPDLYSRELMTGRGMGRYCYTPAARADGERFLKEELQKGFKSVNILYIV